MFCFCPSTNQKKNMHFSKICIFTIYIYSVHAQPLACFVSTQSVFWRHAIVFVSLGNAELTPILTYLQNIFVACTLERSATGLLCEHTERTQGLPNVFLRHAIVFMSLKNDLLTPILTYLRHILIVCTLSHWRAPWAHRACTENTQCVLKTCHCVCELEKCWIDTHIDIFTTYIHSVHAQPPVCLESTQSVHRVFKAQKYVVGVT